MTSFVQIFICGKESQRLFNDFMRICTEVDSLTTGPSYLRSHLYNLMMYKYDINVKEVKEVLKALEFKDTNHIKTLVKEIKHYMNLKLDFDTLSSSKARTILEGIDHDTIDRLLSKSMSSDEYDNFVNKLISDVENESLKET